MPLDETIVADVANSNFKVIANATASGIAQAGSLAALNATSNQHSMNLITQAFLAEAILPRAGVDVSEAVGVKKVAEADLARTIDELGAAIAALQQIMKGAQTTRPETGAG
jgi:hypothetical protein